MSQMTRLGKFPLQIQPSQKHRIPAMTQITAEGENIGHLTTSSIISVYHLSPYFPIGITVVSAHSKGQLSTRRRRNGGLAPYFVETEGPQGVCNCSS